MAQEGTLENIGSLAVVAVTACKGGIHILVLLIINQSVAIH